MARALPYRKTEERRAREVIGYVGVGRGKVIALNLHEAYDAIGKQDTSTYWFGVLNALKAIEKRETEEREERTARHFVEIKAQAKGLMRLHSTEALRDVLYGFGCTCVSEIPAPRYKDVLTAIAEKSDELTTAKRKTAARIAQKMLRSGDYFELKEVLRAMGVTKAAHVPADRLDELIEGYTLALAKCETKAAADSIRGFEKRAVVLTPADLAALGYEIRESKRGFMGRYRWWVVDRRTGQHLLKSNAGPGVAADRFRKKLGLAR